MSSAPPAQLFVNCNGPALLTDVLDGAIRLGFAAGPLPSLTV